MSVDTPNEIPDAQEDLEPFKGDKSAPFATLEKNQNPAFYPQVFATRLKSNWPEVKELMEWNKKDAILDWRTFQVAKEPNEVVKSIQNKILEKGGILPKYGKDGKFGPETEKALKGVLGLPSQPEKQGTPKDVIPSSNQKSPEDERSLKREKTREAVGSMSKVEANLKAADVDFDYDVYSQGVSDLDLMQFQSRAKQLREDMVGKEPLLKPLEPLVEVAIPAIEKEVTKIDLSKINSVEDLTRSLTELEHALEVRLDPYKEQFNDPKIKEILEKADIECLLTFFMSAVNELAMVLVNHFSHERENLKRIIEMLKKEFEPTISQYTRPRTIRVETNSRQTPANSVEPMDHDRLTIPYKTEKGEEQVLVDLKTLTLHMAGDKSARLVLPEGVTVQSIQLQSNGDLSLVGNVAGFTQEKIIKKQDLDEYFGKVREGKEGDKVDIGSGVYLEIVQEHTSPAKVAA